MAKYVKFLPGPYKAPMPEGESGTMLKYLQNKYGDKPVDQFELMTELNTHQNDGVVLSGPQVRPLSQIFGFKIGRWVKDGFAERVSQKKIAPPPMGRIAQMEAYIRDLEAKLEALGQDVTPWQWSKAA